MRAAPGRRCRSRRPGVAQLELGQLRAQVIQGLPVLPRGAGLLEVVGAAVPQRLPGERRRVGVPVGGFSVGQPATARSRGRPGAGSSGRRRGGRTACSPAGPAPARRRWPAGRAAAGSPPPPAAPAPGRPPAPASPAGPAGPAGSNASPTSACTTLLRQPGRLVQQLGQRGVPVGGQDRRQRLQRPREPPGLLPRPGPAARRGRSRGPAPVRVAGPQHLLGVRGGQALVQVQAPLPLPGGPAAAPAGPPGWSRSPSPRARARPAAPAAPHPAPDR